MEKIVVVVEEVEVARTALRWVLHNILRYGDVVTLLHVYPSQRSRNKKKLRRLRLHGFQLALSFRDMCAAFPNAKTEIVVTEGDEEGRRVAAVVREIGASTLVVGLHDRSFLYRYMTLQNNSTRQLNCKVLAIKEPATTLTSATISIQGCSNTTMDFSQIELSCPSTSSSENTIPNLSGSKCYNLEIKASKKMLEKLIHLQKLVQLACLRTTEKEIKYYSDERILCCR